MVTRGFSEGVPRAFALHLCGGLSVLDFDIISCMLEEMGTFHHLQFVFLFFASSEDLSICSCSFFVPLALPYEREEKEESLVAYFQL